MAQRHFCLKARELTQLLLKQARAFGVGVMLATQNPVDLDYKGLSNCGTWFLGRLQTERDKLRVIDGLQGSLGEGGGLDRSTPGPWHGRRRACKGRSGHDGPQVPRHQRMHERLEQPHLRGHTK